MPAKLTYAHHGDACRAANALDLVGDRWTLIVVRELLLGPKRFADLQEAVCGITPAVLSDRLRSLRQAGIVEQVTLPDLARTRAYVVTEWGRGLESVLASLGRWYSAGRDPRTTGGMTPDATILAMRTMAPPVPDNLPPTTLRLYDARQTNPPVREYHLAAVERLLHVQPGAADNPVATVTAESTVWSEVLFDGLLLAEAEGAGTVRVEGDRDTVARIIRLYPAGSDR
ncbi:DNA-binding transcriptional regulator, HxlR family [Micromonospora phaseoli]|uniref:DNA-binding transcriptional regulator, HxlR family n=1 Tax=Micromonospora phaseoli TaxID=1144548 RepID=A0A1H6RVB9_9ACTN|nr:helix-turn-helix domain-containing protein [Micromonospora phaseoli]PZW03678.1 HxlR family transcriptional regulator [Micromonospora phaseoli]GIJ80338.1 transcriptional regulator [Micromonospora phaseoli]SEI59691.1 DNA-binding transcriptional regulator, HxlR family [Micromonospora phaseoli]